MLTVIKHALESHSEVVWFSVYVDCHSKLPSHVMLNQED